MPLVQTRGAASAQGFGEFAVVTVPNYIEDVFSTFLYTGNGSTQTITNGIDLSTKGGLVWIKSRSNAEFHRIFDTVRGVNQSLSSNTTNAQNAAVNTVTAFNTTGFNLGNDSDGNGTNTSAYTYASWTFRKQPKFFDVVTYTGNGGASQTINHNLGSVPGCMIVKSTSTVENWKVYHRSLGTPAYQYLLNLNTTDSRDFTTSRWASDPTSTTFTVASNTDVNASGVTYVAYLFAHDAGGFGLTGTDNVISCGSYTGNGSATGTVVTLGYEPQWVMVKRATVSTGSWEMYDSMRGFTMEADAVLRADTSGAEFSLQRINPTSTGFQLADNDGDVNANGSTYIYIAIRRGPMKVPTVGTSVYKANTYTGNATANTTVAGNFGFPVDLLLLSSRSANSLGWASYGQIFLDRLRGSDVTLSTGSAGGETGGWSTYQSFAVQNSIGWGLYGADSGTNYFNNSGGTWVAQGFARAPNFFDEVCYSGTGSATTQAHNLGVVPELMIIKQRTGSQAWPVYVSSLGATNAVFLSTTAAVASSSSFNNTAPTASVFSVGSGPQTNGSGSTYVAWLFATLTGVSKVGSYTGTGTTLQIDCGFTAGARFVLIKRTDSTGDWYVWDSARGIIAGNDPYLLLNTTAAEVTSTDYIDTYSAGFEISSTAPAAINASAGTFVFLAVA